MKKIECIGILTSGGDAPGMNAAIRAVTRAAIFKKMTVKAIKRGYKGLIENDIEDFKTQNVSNIIQQGGTILKTARSEEFNTYEGMKKAYENAKAHGIDALVVLGGDGTFAGAKDILNNFGIPVVGIPCTIDNDLSNTDYTIGYDTALNTIIEAVDKIRDTANSHDRLFFIEVMGRNSGFLALNGAIASGAESVIIPDICPAEIDELENLISNGFRKTKKSSIVLVAESKTMGALQVAEEVKKKHPEYDTRVIILGHIQRGGSPTAFDRILASKMGIEAVNALLENDANVMIGIDNCKITRIPIDKARKNNEPADKNKLLEIVKTLSI